jgi:hypothetical protein
MSSFSCVATTSFSNGQTACVNNYSSALKEQNECRARLLLKARISRGKIKEIFSEQQEEPGRTQTIWLRGGQKDNHPVARATR